MFQLNRKNEVTKFTNLNIIWKLVTKHIKETENTQRVKNVLMHREYGVSTRKGERFYSKKWY